MADNDGSFLSSTNICGSSLLQLVARANSIIAELSRLAEHIPAALMPGSADPMAAKYEPILFDFRYLRAPDLYDSRINTNLALSDLDDEFQQTHEVVLSRFYSLFESIHRYITEYQKFLEDLSSGFYVQHTVDTVLLDKDGKRLMCEALYLLGVIYLFLDLKVPGPTRERLLIAHYRYKGDSAVSRIDDLARLCRATGFLPGAKRPADYPEDYFARFPVPREVVMMVVDRLRSDDVYDLTRVFPSPEHRSSALSQQASMLHVVLYFVPNVLHEHKSMMREIVDKHFNDNWVIPVYMGVLSDLAEEWAPYRAAREALANDCLQVATLKRLLAHHVRCMETGEKAVDDFLTEGVLTEQYVVDNIVPLMNCMRKCNTTLRWILLHRRTTHRKFGELIMSTLPPPPVIFNFLLKNAQFEFKLKKIFNHLLETKEQRWSTTKANTAGMLTELSEYFSGEKALTRVERDEHLMEWFSQLSVAVQDLDFHVATTAGRTIQGLIKALEDCEQYEAIDTSTHIKEFLLHARDNLVNMIRTVNVRNEVMANIDTISDLSYAWDIMNDFMPHMHERIQKDPKAVVLLRATFLKLTSVLELPLARIAQANSRDAVSVAEHYSSELVAFVRRVMEAIPVIVFDILSKIIELQTSGMRALPTKLELGHLREAAQLDQRFKLAQHTHRVSVFTEGVLAMETTLLGVIQVDPRKILNDGIRKHLVRKIAQSLHQCLVFDPRASRSKDPKAGVEGQLVLLARELAGFKESFEYIQDYISIYGLKMWQEEYSRIISFNVEQECNRFVKRRVLPKQSRYQSKAIPVPMFRPVDDKSVNFLGRMSRALLSLTDPRRTIFSPSCSGWFDQSGRELAGQGLLALLHRSLGVHGLTGLDRLFAFRCSRDLNRILRHYKAECDAGVTNLLGSVSVEVSPLTTAPKHGLKTYHALVQKVKKALPALLEGVHRVGQVQILRREIAHQLKFACRLNSNLLSGALTTLNTAVLNDIRRHYHASDKYPYPATGNPLLPELSKYLEAAGIHDPLTKIYLTCEPQPHIALYLTAFVIYYMSKFVYDRDFDTLVRKKSSEGIDGTPFVFGLATILKQLHPTVTRQMIGYLGQYVRLSCAEVFSSSKPSALPVDVVNTLLLIRHLANAAALPRRVLETYIPSYILDAATLS